MNWRIPNRPIRQSDRTAETLTGKKLEAIVLNTVVLKNKLRYGATFHFEGGFRLQVYMYDRGNYETIFMLYTPEEVVSYDYDGVIRTETMEA